MLIIKLENNFYINFTAIYAQRMYTLKEICAFKFHMLHHV